MLIRRKARSKEGNNSSKKETRYSFEGHSSRSQHWFDLDINWIETKFNKMEPGF